MASPYYISARALDMLQTLSEELGQNFYVEAVAEGYDINLFGGALDRVDYLSYCDLLEKCAEKWNEPELGRIMAQRQSLELLGYLSLVPQLGLSLRDTIEIITQSFDIYTNALVLSLAEGDGHCATLSFSFLPSQGVGLQEKLSSLFYLLHIHESLLGSREHVIELHCPDRACLSSLKSLSLPINHDAPCFGYAFDAEILDRKIGVNDPAQAKPVIDMLGKLRASAGVSTAEQVSRQIWQHAEFSDVEIGRISRQLGLEPRSLQRRLANECTSFSKLFDCARRDRAMHLLEHSTMSLNSIADCLGFSEQSTLSRAVKRWTGRSPKDLRR
ncbi:MAG: AraC family transcriptional regulator [Mangrovicoccus sp.]|nr:AraC family transcriptional regulator [Mangrovicoccus sp.]